jgi:flagellar basal-body rod modification protein FlgD
MINQILGPVGQSDIDRFAPSPNPNLGKDEFLQLLVAQLQSQDPLNPSKPEEFAAQLAQFSSVEQLININETLAVQADSNTAMADALNNTSAMTAIGRDVLSVGDRVQVGPDFPSTVTLGVGGAGGDATLTLQDADGNTVATIDVGELGPGRQTISLQDYEVVNGLPQGTYRYEVQVQGAEGAVEVETFSSLRIDGVRYTPQGPVLLSGDVEIPLSSVVELVSSESRSSR